MASLAGRVHGLRLADDVLTGRDLIGPAFRELRAAVRRRRERSYADAVGRALLVQIGELVPICGWIACDAGRYDDAEHAYRLGISAARQALQLRLVVEQQPDDVAVVRSRPRTVTFRTTGDAARERVILVIFLLSGGTEKVAFMHEQDA